LTFCGDLLLCPLVVTFTRLRAVRRKGVNEHGGADVQGAVYRVPFTLDG
jgi:hypothetical protein